MRHTAAEKAELIRLVEGSELSGRQTVRELRLNRSTFYDVVSTLHAAGPGGAHADASNLTMPPYRQTKSRSFRSIPSTDQPPRGTKAERLC